MKSFQQYINESFTVNSYHKVHIEKDGKKTSFMGKYLGQSSTKNRTIHRFDEVDKEGVPKGREQWVQHEYIKKTIPHQMNLKYGVLEKSK